MALAVDQPLPSNTHAERTILGACLVDDVALIEATNLLTSDDFFLESHRRVFAAIQSMQRRDEAVDTITVTDKLRKLRELDSVGGPVYVANLPDGLPRKLNVESYVAIVRNAARLRDLAKMTDAIGNAVLMNEDDAETLTRQSKQWLEEIENNTGSDKPMESVADYLNDHYTDVERIFDLDPEDIGVPTGFAWQDAKTGGLKAGKLYIYAARPSMGKSAKVVCDICNLTLKAKVPTAAFTFEDSKRDTLQRLLCVRASANLTDYIEGKSDAGDRNAIKKAYADYLAAPLYWDNSPGLTVTQIRAKVIRLNKSLPADKKIKVIYIDQLSFLSWADVFEKGVRTDQLIGFMTRNLKKMAKELGVAVVLVCQLGRSSTKNKDAKPTLADLKDSGSIEENADVVIFFHRAEYYDRTDESLKGKGEHIIAKQRQGPVGSHVLHYKAKCVKWVDDWTPKDADEGDQIPW